MGPDQSVGVTVPATTANLGPGYDVLAAALDFGLEAWTTTRLDTRVRCDGEGADELPCDEGNLIWQAFVAYCEHFEVPVPDVGLRTRSRIPLERGLGSSAAAAVAGVALGRAATRAGGSDQDLIDLASHLEGHADNAAAAVLGGVIALVDGVARRFEPAPGLRPVVCIPTTRQATHAARAIVPGQVPLAVAASNAGRAAMVLAGLIGATALDVRALTDQLHEPARLEAMGASGALVNSLRDKGLPACLSGAGPSVLAVIGARDDRGVETIHTVAGDGWHVLPSAWDRAGAAVMPPAALPGG